MGGPQGAAALAESQCEPLSVDRLLPRRERAKGDVQSPSNNDLDMKPMETGVETGHSFAALVVMAG